MADYVKKRTHIINHVRFLDAGAVARDLYDWGMLWSGQQETDGELPLTAIVTAQWGAGGRKNVAVADKLVLVGLWEKTETGYRIRKWAEQGNVTRAELVAKRDADRERKAVARSRVRGQSELPVQDLSARTPSGFPSSTSTSTSFGSDLVSRSDQPDRSGGPEPPAWWNGAAEAAAMSIGGEITDLRAYWASYAAARERKGWPKNHTDAVGWLCDVVRRERRDQKSKPAAKADTRQPLSDPNAKWLTDFKTGTDGGDL